MLGYLLPTRPRCRHRRGNRRRRDILLVSFLQPGNGEQVGEGAWAEGGLEDAVRLR